MARVRCEPYGARVEVADCLACGRCPAGHARAAILAGWPADARAAALAREPPPRSTAVPDGHDYDDLRAILRRHTIRRR